jgi:glycerate 2-kinase
MNILIAPDSFKGSLSATEAAEAIRQGVKAVMPEAETVGLPLADGGEGTVEAMVTATQGRFLYTNATGPLGEQIEARWGILGDDVTAVIEMASVAGLSLVPPEKRNPLLTTTYGVGELIKAVLDAKCSKLIIGIGGSATNDGGAGMAQALGADLLDETGRSIGRGGGELAKVAKVSRENMDKRLTKLEIKIAADVNNPLCGPQGASVVYGPQKGATPEMVAGLDAGLHHYAEIIARDIGIDVLEQAGAGAAGGLGAGLMAFCYARLHSGVALVLEASNFAEYLQAADLVITGEGRLDEQMQFGKALAGLGALAKHANVPVLALAGMIDIDTEKLDELGIAAALPCPDRPLSEAEAMAQAADLLQGATERALRLLLLGKDLASKSLPACEDRKS